MTNAPELLPPSDTPPLLTATDVLRQWRALMGELGFADRSLWVMLLDGTGRPLPVLPRIDELPALPYGVVAPNIVAVCRSLMDRGDGPLGRVAFLLSRPGCSAVTTSDQAWADALVREAELSGLPFWPVHIASDELILPYDLPLAA